jgi:hypothetical protein
MPACHAAGALALAITYAEQPVRLVGDTAMFSAARGALLRKDDILTMGDGAILIEADGATAALGPASRVYISTANELVLLDGWLKVQGRAEPGVRVKIPGLQITASGATAMLCASVGNSTGMSEVFAEAGELAIDDVHAGKAARRLRLPADGFAVRTGAQPVRVLARPQATYLAAMPATFRDLLVAVPRSAATAPKRERAATYADVAPWLAGHPDLCQRVQRRFHPPRPAGSTPARSH